MGPFSFCKKRRQAISDLLCVKEISSQLPRLFRPPQPMSDRSVAANSHWILPLVLSGLRRARMLTSTTRTMITAIAIPILSGVMRPEGSGVGAGVATGGGGGATLARAKRSRSAVSASSGFKFQGGLQIGNCLRVLIHERVRVSALVIDVGIVRVLLDGGGVIGQRLVPPFQAAFCEAAALKELGIVWIFSIALSKSAIALSKSLLPIWAKPRNL